MRRTKTFSKRHKVSYEDLFQIHHIALTFRLSDAASTSQSVIAEWHQKGMPRKRTFSSPHEAHQEFDKLNIFVKIEKLHLEETKGLFSGDWMRRFIPHQPFLRHISLTNSHITNEDFSVICNSSIPLDYLNISGSKITDLTGVSELENLKVLLLADCQLESAQAMRDVFSLEKLKVLDISGQVVQTVTNARYFWKYKGGLPALEFLDCSQNDVSPGMVRDILFHRPTIKTIGLHCVDFEETEYFPVEVLDSANVENARRAVEHYVKWYSIYKIRISHIIHVIHGLMEKEYARQSKESIQNFLTTILRVRENKGNLLLDRCVAGVIGSLGRQNFPFLATESRYIVNVLLTMLNWKHSAENSCSIVYHTHDHVWFSFLSKVLLEAAEDLSQICVRAIVAMETPDEPFQSATWSLYTGIKLLNLKGLYKPGNAAFDKLSGNKNVYMKMLQLFETADPFKHGPAVLGMASRFPLATSDREYKILLINTVLDYVERTFETMSSTIEFMIQFVGKRLEPYETAELLKRKRLDMYFKIMKFPSDFEIIPVLLTINCYINVMNDKYEANLPLSKTAIMEFMEEIAIVAEKSVLEGTDDELEAYREMCASKEANPDVVRWAQWFLSNFEEERPRNDWVKLPQKWPLRQKRE